MLTSVWTEIQDDSVDGIKLKRDTDIGFQDSDYADAMMNIIARNIIGGGPAGVDVLGKIELKSYDWSLSLFEVNANFDAGKHHPFMSMKKWDGDPFFEFKSDYSIEDQYSYFLAPMHFGTTGNVAGSSGEPYQMLGAMIIEGAFTADSLTCGDAGLTVGIYTPTSTQWDYFANMDQYLHTLANVVFGSINVFDYISANNSIYGGVVSSGSFIDAVDDITSSGGSIISSTGNIQAVLGALIAGTTISAFGNITTSDGNVNVTKGNITAEDATNGIATVRKVIAKALAGQNAIEVPTGNIAVTLGSATAKKIIGASGAPGTEAIESTSGYIKSAVDVITASGTVTTPPAGGASLNDIRSKLKKYYFDILVKDIFTDVSIGPLSQLITTVNPNTHADVTTLCDGVETPWPTLTANDTFTVKRKSGFAVATPLYTFLSFHAEFSSGTEIKMGITNAFDSIMNLSGSGLWIRVEIDRRY